jgi:hypothetical protein
MTQPHTDCNSSEHGISRRQMLHGVAGAAGAVSLGGLMQPALADELKRQQKQVLLVFNDGGMSQLESWDPKPGTDFGGPFRAIPTSVPGTHVSELMPHTAKQMHRLALVRGMNTKNPSHGSRMFAFNGDPKNRGVRYPDLGAAVAKFLQPDDATLPPCVLVKPYSGGFDYKAAGFLGSQYGTLLLGEGKPPVHMTRPQSVSDTADGRRNEFRKLADSRFTKGRRTAETSAYARSFDMAEQLVKRRDLFDESAISKRDAERYGTHKHGRHLLLGRNLLEAGVTFVEVRSYHWDTHSSNFDLHVSKMGDFDRPFAALIEDLAESGRLENTLVIVLSEFGRTPKINVGLGRDHWPQAWSMCLAGSGIKGGSIHGKTNAAGTWVDDGQTSYADLFHTYFHALGIDTHKTEYNNAGQPLPLANEDAAPIKTVLT